MHARLAVLALALAVCHAFPQHAGSYSSFGSASYGGGHFGGNLGGRGLGGGGYGGFGGGYGGGYGGNFGGGYGGHLGGRYGGNFGGAFGGHQGGGYGGNFGSGGYGGNFGGGFGGHGYGRQSYVAAVAPVAAVAKVVAPVAVKAVAPVVVGKQVAHQVDYFAPPHYQFEYAVEDKHTGDSKSQHEQREGDSTKGYYTVHEPDGTLLTVHYTVDKDSGFQAVVERTGHAAHPQPVKKVAVVAPVVHHAPILQSKYY